MADTADEICPICQQDLCESPQVTALECNHKFCTHCILRNFRGGDNKSCPVCRHLPSYAADQSRFGSRIVFNFGDDSDSDSEQDEQTPVLHTMRQQHIRLLRRAYACNTRHCKRLRNAKTRLDIAKRDLRNARRAAMRDANYKKARARYATVRRQVVWAEAAAVREQDGGTSDESLVLWRDVCGERYPKWYDESGFSHENSMLADILDSIISTNDP